MNIYPGFLFILTKIALNSIGRLMDDKSGRTRKISINTRWDSFGMLVGSMCCEKWTEVNALRRPDQGRSQQQLGPDPHGVGALVRKLTEAQKKALVYATDLEESALSHWRPLPCRSRRLLRTCTTNSSQKSRLISTASSKSRLHIAKHVAQSMHLLKIWCVTLTDSFCVWYPQMPIFWLEFPPRV